MTSLEQINWTGEYTGAGVPLGSLDGWPAVDHPELAGRITISRLATNANYAPFSWNADHATAVAGIAVGRGGVARGASLVVVPMYISSDQFVFYDFYRSTFLARVCSEMAARGVKCFNRELSWSRKPSWGMEAVWGWNAFRTATDLDLVASHKQFVHVQAAGNQGLPIGSQPFQLPASELEHLLIVGAVDSNNRLWPSSNTPQNRGLYARADTVIKPDNFLKNFFVCAPGVGLQAPGAPSGYLNGINGTSYAAPFVQGLIALMYEKAAKLGIVLTPQRAAKIVKETCTLIGPREVYGHGVINCKAALEAV